MDTVLPKEGDLPLRGTGSARWPGISDISGFIPGSPKKKGVFQGKSALLMGVLFQIERGPVTCLPTHWLILLQAGECGDYFIITHLASARVKQTREKSFFQVKYKKEKSPDLFRGLLEKRKEFCEKSASAHRYSFANRRRSPALRDRLGINPATKE
jgi:hypothetical protein